MYVVNSDFSKLRQGYFQLQCCLDKTVAAYKTENDMHTVNFVEYSFYTLGFYKLTSIHRMTEESDYTDTHYTILPSPNM